MKITGSSAGILFHAAEGPNFLDNWAGLQGDGARRPFLAVRTARVRLR